MNNLLYNSATSLQRRSYSVSELNSSSCALTIKTDFQKFIKHSENEKSIINECNGLLSNYVDQVKNLESENSRHLVDLKEMGNTWGYASTGAQVQLEHTLDGLRARIESNENLKCDAQLHNEKSHFELNEYNYRQDELKNHIDRLKEKLNKLKDEHLQRENVLKYLNENYDRVKYEMDKSAAQRDSTWSNLLELYEKFNFEALKRVATENSVTTLREKTEFLKKIFEKQEEEMRALSENGDMLQQSTNEFYRDHLKRVIKDIRSDYERLAEEKIKTMRDWMVKVTEDLKTKYSQPITTHEAYFEVENISGLKANLVENSKEINELKNSNKQLLKRLNELEEHAEMENNRINETIYQQNLEINKLNEDINELTSDCFHLDSYKAIHDSELQVYKRLVDTEIKRLNENSNNENFSISVFEGKVKNRKEVCGDIGIDEVSPNGQYILIRNYGTLTTVNLTGWSLRRKLGNASTIEYNFPNNTHIMPNEFIRIWGSLFYPKESNDKCDILNTDIESWGFGVSTETNLLNTNLDSVSVFHQNIDFERY